MALAAEEHLAATRAVVADARARLAAMMTDAVKGVRKLCAEFTVHAKAAATINAKAHASWFARPVELGCNEEGEMYLDDDGNPVVRERTLNEWVEELYKFDQLGNSTMDSVARDVESFGLVLVDTRQVKRAIATKRTPIGWPISSPDSARGTVTLGGNW